jgi:hypothetical protein
MTMATSTAFADDVIWLYRLNEKLETTRELSWRAKGKIAGPLYFLPEREVMALVEARGRFELVRWTTAGKEARRTPVEMTGTLVASRLNGDGTLTVVTSDRLLRLAGDGRTLAQRALTLPMAEVALQEASADDERAVVASPGGAWFAFKDRLVYEGLDGKEMVKRAPIGLASRDYEGEWFGRIPLIVVGSMLATERDECLLAENVSHGYDVSGTHRQDATNQVVLSLIGSDGTLVAQRVLGKARSELEWFWIEDRGSQSLLPSIPTVGLVRRRHYGRVGVALHMGRANGDILLDISGMPKLYDHMLRQRWAAEGGAVFPEGVSSPWTRGMLLFSAHKHGWTCVYDEQGKIVSDTVRWIAEKAWGPEPEYDPNARPPPRKWARAAVGQSPSGEWLVAVNVYETPPDLQNAQSPRDARVHQPVAPRNRRGRDDLVLGDEYLQPRFEGLLAGRRYTLRRLVAAERTEVVFEDVPYSEVLDQARTGAAALEGGRFAQHGEDRYEEVAIEPLDEER